MSDLFFFFFCNYSAAITRSCRRRFVPRVVSAVGRVQGCQVPVGAEGSREGPEDVGGEARVAVLGG